MRLLKTMRMLTTMIVRAQNFNYNVYQDLWTDYREN